MDEFKTQAEIYKETKKKKIVRLHNYTYENKNGIYETGFSSLRFDQFPIIAGYKLILTDSKDIEVDDD